MVSSLDDVESVKTPMDLCWQFSYEIDDEKLRRLYTKSKKLQWDAEQDIDWTTPIDPSRPLIDEDQFALTSLPFIRRLSTSQQESLRAHIAAFQLSQFLHGEQGALMTAGALTHSVPDYEAKLYAATQTMDEARHVEVYDRYIKKLAIVYPIAPVLKALIDKTLRSDHWVKIAVGMNMVVEGLALASFHNMRRATSCDLLRSIIAGVLRDEARHVAFGSLYVKDTVSEMHADDREDVAQFAFEAVVAMRDARGRRDEHYQPDPGFARVLDEVGIDRADFARGVVEARSQGIRVRPPTGTVHAFRDLMMPALVRVGVVTDRARALYRDRGIKVYEDYRVLEAMEQSEGGNAAG